MSFKVPTCWKELTEQQLRHVIRLLWLSQEHPELQSAIMLYLYGIRVVKRTDQGWLCQEKKSGDHFIIDPDVMLSMKESVDWVLQPEKMDVRIERVGRYQAVDFELRDLMFGDYLACENFFQAFLSSHEEARLVELTRKLYQVPDSVEEVKFEKEVIAGAFLWFNAAKQVLGEWFPHFLKPAGEVGGSGTRENQLESTRAQIRLLTKGDVTKQDYIMNHTDTWTALGELDALAMEAEEIKQKYGKK